MVVVSDSITPLSILSSSCHFTSLHSVMCMSVCFRVMTEGGTSPSGWVYLTEIVFDVCVYVCVMIWERRVSGGQH